MTHTYNITGMTCNGCVARVKDQLLKLDGITLAEVQ
ncbi:MAG: heavy-metal-associated domain-containing protein, partial [Tolypothrix sp. T3-bin4]|nr:heavy-metal-associated domain-containing protein [Tolypothrix sp. T3-bin4]